MAMAISVMSCKKGSATARPNPLDFHARLVGSGSELAVTLRLRPEVGFRQWTLDGPDAASFVFHGTAPNGTYFSRQDVTVSFRFTPTRLGVFEAAWSSPGAYGTVTPLELVGIGANEIEVGELWHLHTYPDGMNFGEVCLGRSAGQPFVVVNHGPTDEIVKVELDPSSPEFTIAPPVPQKIRRNNGRYSYTIAYSPTSPAHAARAGVTFYGVTTRESRTGVLAMGKGKVCDTP